MRALISLLEEDGLVHSERLEKMWSERCERDAVEQRVSRDVRPELVCDYDCHA